MKKISLFIMVASLTIFLAGCTQQALPLEEPATHDVVIDELPNEDGCHPSMRCDEGNKCKNGVCITIEEYNLSKNSIYKNDKYGYSTSYPEGWNYIETGGTYFSQAVGFNPPNSSDEDYRVIIAVLSVDRQEYLNSFDSNSNLKIDREFSNYLVNGLPASKFVYKNLSTGKTFSVFIITSNNKTYVITPNESFESVFLDSFELN